MPSSVWANALAFAVSPAGQLAGGIAIAVGGGCLAMALRQPQARAGAQVLADLSEAVEPWVRRAEELGVIGAIARGQKLSWVLDQGQAWLDRQGIKGDARRVAELHLPAFVEAAVKRLPAGPPRAASPLDRTPPPSADRRG